MPLDGERVRKLWMTHLCEDYGLEPFEAEVIYADVLLNFRVLLRNLRLCTDTEQRGRLTDILAALRSVAHHPGGNQLQPICEILTTAQTTGAKDLLGQAIRDLQTYCEEAGCDVRVTPEDVEQDDEL